MDIDQTRAALEGLLANALQAHQRNAPVLIERRRLLTVGLNLGMAAKEALHLAQLQLRADDDLQRALDTIGCTLDDRLKPSLADICRSCERLACEPGLVKPELGNLLPHVLCYVLAGQADRLRAEYAAIDRPELFNQAEWDSNAAFLVRVQVRLARGERFSDGEPEPVSSRDKSKKSALHGYPELFLDAARDDAPAFNARLGDLATKFAARQRAKGDAFWGYDTPPQYCFDVLGTAACALAHRNGLDVAVPEASAAQYPRALWHLDDRAPGRSGPL